MSKALSTEAILTRFSTTADNAIRFSGVTPELDSSQKIALMELHGRNVIILIQPKDSIPDEIILVKTDIEQRTPSERLRGVLWHLWKQTACGDSKSTEADFTPYYIGYMETLITSIKAKLEKQPF